MADPRPVPVTVPADTVPIAALLLVHVPPAPPVLPASILPPIQTGAETVTDGLALIVMLVLFWHPFGAVYIAVATPAVEPVNIPVSISMVPPPGVLQVPPVTALVSVVLPSTHTEVLPDIGGIAVETVIVFVATPQDVV